MEVPRESVSQNNDSLPQQVGSENDEIPTSPHSSTGSSKYNIREAPDDFHYAQDRFNQRKFLDVAHSFRSFGLTTYLSLSVCLSICLSMVLTCDFFLKFRIVPKNASNSYLEEFERLKPYIVNRIEAYLEEVSFSI